MNQTLNPDLCRVAGSKKVRMIILWCLVVGDPILAVIFYFVMGGSWEKFELQLKLIFSLMLVGAPIVGILLNQLLKKTEVDRQAESVVFSDNKIIVSSTIKPEQRYLVSKITNYQDLVVNGVRNAIRINFNDGKKLDFYWYNLEVVENILKSFGVTKK